MNTTSNFPCRSTPMDTGVTKLPWPKGRALSRSVHSSDILGGPILYSRGYSTTDSSRIAMGGKGLIRNSLLI